ncbi:MULTISPECIES: YceI family protein [Myroides]|uniref:YceI family protein n=1 Tax=Myroides albus TaxID=2562892 RepID=A0A6I3LHK1_9FLAO|nr:MULTISPECIES: YceI family protein [Myroides]MTG99049.1 YceI family protein [Myroides albus]MVX36647.1 YceI family protein [Myroides sp. LoEW2-1]UVD80406.1 YceI family protein [Myroides albus]
MKKIVLTLAVIATLSLTSCGNKNADKATTTTEQEVTTPAADAINYNVVAADSKIDWVGGKISGDNHTGTITLKEGKVFVKEGKVTNGTFVLDMNTINVTDITDPDGKAGLEAHLKGSAEEKADHFFNVGKYPTATFELTSIAEENGKQMVTGNLTVKEATNAITFPATVTVTDNDVTIVSEEFAIDRTKWGVNFNSGSIVKDLAGDKIINDEIKIKISTKATK